MTTIKQFKLIGLTLKTKTTNENGQSMIDCGNLWQQFGAGSYADKIPGKLTNEVFAVYHNYEGDHTNPFSFFIGCKVKADTKVPEGMDGLVIQPLEFSSSFLFNSIILPLRKKSV